MKHTESKARIPPLKGTSVDAFIRTETQPRQCTENIKIEKGPSYNSMFVDGSTLWVVQCVCREFILVLSTFDTMR